MPTICFDSLRIMELATFYSFLVYSLVTAITPGPNNIMLTASGLNFGFRRSIPHILGVAMGFGVMVAVVGLGIGNLLKSSPALFETIRVLGIFYLLYLSWRIATAGASSSSSNTRGRPLGFVGAALFQWVNPKSWIITLSAVTSYTSNTNGSLTLFLTLGLIYTIVSLPAVSAWAYMGSRLQDLAADARRMRWFNWSMALLLASSVLPSIQASLQYFSL
ncbi:LysE family translocator [Kerstersia gyiorum]|uniref:LysE family translocator n=1 Tax=Kerstersia gyiorum TaxID=206506 RepID=UPI00196B0C08|nr:LysE family translocator [Kerstersia gyiorum]MCO7636683.1 LysE family translocator [Pseudomonas sp. S 311-6]MCP1634461.1 threonine/homoserine/homoserine lactone efflux protein [Kerstersia gyiorum]MCP1636063.1 threonine/homoserine/homoserine lactone efflux protein [Kerstersia gyiorum]MCP1672245.1 threonine/homoserine/homoserine lactone efflux protein [Kerstersia gyiorum]MCP1680266.1 threonine/homoserine/homoserine lactone efflux protein [Kerstersia gyiorum]